MRVLVADSVRMFQQLISSLFENTGLEPVVAQSGAECMSALERDRFGFICISMHMEDVNGVELCKAIRRTTEHAHTPIILFTSEDSANLLSQAIAAGVTEIFNKTKDLDQLVAYIKRFTLQHSPIEGNVLYVEDSRSLRLNTKELLRDKGLTVDGFSKAEIAWEAFDQKTYDLVITDILLAGHMSGLSLVNKIRRLDDRRGDVPILAVTGFDDIARRIELFHMGVNDYAIKPIVEEELLARVRYLIGTSRALERQLNLIRGIFDYSPNGIAIIDHQGSIEQVNDALLHMTGLQSTDIKGKNIVFLESEQQHEARTEDIWAILENQGHWDGEFTLTGASGQTTTCMLILDRIESGSSSVMNQYMGIWREKR